MSEASGQPGFFFIEQACCPSFILSALIDCVSSRISWRVARIVSSRLAISVSVPPAAPHRPVPWRPDAQRDSSKVALVDHRLLRCGLGLGRPGVDGCFQPGGQIIVAGRGKAEAFFKGGNATVEPLDGGLGARQCPSSRWLSSSRSPARSVRGLAIPAVLISERSSQRWILPRNTDAGLSGSGKHHQPKMMTMSRVASPSTKPGQITGPPLRFRRAP